MHVLRLRQPVQHIEHPVTAGPKKIVKVQNQRIPHFSLKSLPCARLAKQILQASASSDNAVLTVADNVNAAPTAIGSLF